MKTTLDIPDDVFRRTKATAALRGESLKEFVTKALRARLDMDSAKVPAVTGWRTVFGRARAAEVAEIDEILASDLARVDADEWR